MLVKVNNLMGDISMNGMAGAGILDMHGIDSSYVLRRSRSRTLSLPL